MPDVFISYSTKDQQVADFVCRHLKAENIDVFMAAQSLQPGQEWTEAIKTALRNSKTIVVLASKAAMQSPFVMFETGGALFIEGKEIWPIIWDLDPRELPEWLRRYQALDLRTLPNVEAFAGHLKQLASQINRDKLIGLGIVAAIIWAIARFG
jgi:hypothetical protein